MSAQPVVWRERSLHWHAYSWRGDGKRLGDSAARRSAAEDIVPFALKDWLLKPARLVRAAPTTPEEALHWLREQFGLCAPAMQPVSQRSFVSDADRFGRALYELRCGNDLSWGFWLTNGLFQALSPITVDAQACPAHAAAVVPVQDVARVTGNATSHTGSSAPAASQSAK
ncbi:hypothetical protein [Streptomyces sp. yr375]|uniref:hypothetical protein n=1 Tax=Streptomyces sp. yr375 TaxID=1761906 RepID=UPI000B8A0638|nr:hypothetical protein [Streptomyces sp. yr375]